MNKQITVFSGVVLKDGKVLLVQRDEKECPDAHLKWEFPGGKVDFGETPQDSVVREIFEETGVKVKLNQLLSFVQTSYWKYSWGNQQTLCFIYTCYFVSQRSVKRDHHVRDVAWVELDGVKKLPTLPGTQEILELVKNVFNPPLP